MYLPAPRALLALSLASLVPNEVYAQRTPIAPETRSEERVPTIETFPVDVELRAVYGSGEDSPPAPGIRVDLGITTTGDGPGGPPLLLNEPILATAVSDEAGRIRATVEVPMEWKTRSACMWARVETPGHTRRLVRFDLRRRAGEKPQRFGVYRGGTLLGRATTEDGSPVAGAHVWLMRAKDGGHELRSSEKTRADGRFALNFYEAGRFGVHVRSPQLGSNPHLEVDVDPARTPEELELVVRGGESAHGRLVDPRGEPVAGAWVTAVEAGSATLTEGLCFEAEREGGLFGGRARTDVEGRFRMPALLPGSYAFHGCYAKDEREAPFGLGPFALGPRLATLEYTGESPLELVAAEHRLEVRIVDESGTVQTGIGKRGPDDGEVAIGELGLSAFPLLDGIAQEFAQLVPVPIGDVFLFDVEPDREYLVTWHRHGVAFFEERVRVPAVPYRIPLELRLGQSVAPAVLEIRVLDPDWNEFMEPRISVVSLATGREVESSVVSDGFGALNKVEGSTWSVELPPGRFRVHASAEPLGGCVSMGPRERAPHLPAAVEVETHAGERALAQVRLRPAGHLDFEPLVPGAGLNAAHLPLFQEAEHPGILKPELARGPLGGGSLVLVSESGRLALDYNDVGGLALDWVVPGWPARCLEPIPPGDWTLRVEDDSRVLFERPIRIEGGRVTTVRW